MRSALSKTYWSFLLAILICISGCTSNQRVDLAETGDVAVVTQPSDEIEILWHQVYVDDQEFVVYGVVEQRGLSNYGVKAHLSVTVNSPSGNVSHTKNLDTIYLPRYLTSKGPNWRRFRARFPGEPENGSTVTIAVR